MGQPARISAEAADVVPGSQLVLLALPAFAHEFTLRDIVPHLDDGVWVGALPARGGFDWCARDVLGAKADQVPRILVRREQFAEA